MRKNKILSVVLMLAGLSNLVSAKDYKPFVTDAEARPLIASFAKRMAEEHQFNEKAVFEQLVNMQHREDIIARITKPAESLPWHRYRPIFMKQKRIDDGVKFWQEHAETLAKAEAEFGVDAAVIVGIIGVETFYGRIQGSFPVIEALHTLGFYYPKRAKFFRSELEHYYLLAREQKWTLSDTKGSYAGAMGMGQFISSSYRHYGYDFNQDGKINLFNDPVDMIGSVANYFKKHRWNRGGFVAQPIEVESEQKKLVQKGLKLSRAPELLRQAGVDTSALEGRTKSAGIFAFEKAKGQYEHWLTGDNFYVITRYNHSEMYALAAYQLAQAIKFKRQQELTKAQSQGH